MAIPNHYHLHLSDQQFSMMSSVLDTLFGIDALNDGKFHQLQELWQRNDMIAAVELYFFADCLNRLMKQDEAWTRKMAKKLKAGDPHNFRGDVFEIIALGIMCHDKNIVKPSPGNFPGIDGTIELDNKKTIRLSIKNYNYSRHEDDFRKTCRRFEGELLKELKKKRIHCELSISCKLEKIGTDDWKDLFAFIGDIVKQFDPAKEIQLAKGAWTILIKPLQPENKEEFSPLDISYIFTMSAPFHPNERDNLIGRITDARDNLIKHVDDDPDGVNIIMVQLPSTASFQKSLQWAEEFLATNEGNALGAILFYQPFFYHDRKEKNFYLINPLKFVTHANQYKRLGLGMNPFPVHFPAGKVMSMPPKKEYGLPGHTLSPEDGLYIYQRGELNYAIAPIKNGDNLDFKVTLQMPTFGVIRNNIFSTGPGVGVKLESVYYPKGDKILLI